MKEYFKGYAFENIAMTHLAPIHKSLGISGVYTKAFSWKLKGDSTTKGSQIDLIIERNDGIIHLCEVKFTSSEFLLTKEYVSKLRERRSLFSLHTKTKKAVITTFISSYPSVQNQYYLEEIHSEVSIDQLFDV